MRTKYVYPAIFTPEEVGFSVRFPDIAGCFTSGETIEEAMSMAEDALCLMIYDMEENQEDIPVASDVRSIRFDEGEFVSLVACDTLEYRRYYNNKAVKKTLSIPAWLNTMAEREDINFSSVLQKALKEELHLA